MRKAAPVDIERVRKFIASREERRQRAIRQRFEQATRDFDRIVDHIIRAYRPTRLYQWGSLLRPGRFSEISDIDIAVEGLTSAESYFTLLAEADEMTGLPVDIVEMEKIHPLHAQSIREKGRLVYEQK